MESGVGTLSASEKPPEAEEGMECCLDKVDKGLEAGHPQKLVDYIQLCIYTYIYIYKFVFIFVHIMYTVYIQILHT
jgi:hypothetical protein